MKIFEFLVSVCLMLLLISCSNKTIETDNFRKSVDSVGLKFIDSAALITLTTEWKAQIAPYLDTIVLAMND